MKVKAKVLYEESRDGVHVCVVKYEDKVTILYADGATKGKDDEASCYVCPANDAEAIRWGIREFDTRTL